MPIRSRFFKYILFLLIPTVFPTLCFAAAGKVAFVLGQVDKKDLNGVISIVNKKSVFETGDIIFTKKNGQLMLVMSDDSKITIRPNSTFHIAEYSYIKNTKADKSHYNLVEGGFRYITGKMGKVNKSSYQLTTAMGTIGIRGTDFEANLCELDCGNDKGLFVNVVNGGISLSNSAGTLDVEPGKIGHIENNSQMPKPAEKLPDIMVIEETVDNDAEHATSEEQMVSLALKYSQTSKSTAIKELVQSGLPENTILIGAHKTGMEPASIANAMIESGADSNNVIQIALEKFPDQSGNILTMGIATGAIDIQQADKLGKANGLNAKKLNSIITTGKLLRPPTVDNKKDAESKSQKQKTEGNSENSTKKIAPGRVNPQLIPKEGNEGGPVPSPS